LALGPGARLGVYEIVSVLGAGGMGEVYRARDTKLGREVAIKVILDVFAADADRIARFQREAKVLASLNHPHIAALYGMEEAGGQHFLVMELVEGQTLADRLARGPLPVEETLAIAVQIAEALEAAHEKGVVHRDLKPANVKVTPEDKVKVLDFGLAKAVETQASSSSAANSPTLSMMASQAGIILGTAAYMSPEQAKGFPADHRSDIFSFGSVVFEMLTGRQPFQGETAPEVLASVLVREPDIARLPPDLNPRLADVVRRCLEKHPKRRWQAIGDVRAELEAIAAAPRSSQQHALAAGPQRPLWRRAVVPATWALVAAALAAAAAWTLKPDRVLRPVRFSIVLPEGQRFTPAIRRTVAISPDGATIVYMADNRIYVRPLDATSSTALPGTESEGGASGPVFSPDGRSIMFYTRGESIMKRTELAGGSPTVFSPAPEFSGAAWYAPGELLIALGGTDRSIKRVPANGGTPELIVALKDDEMAEGLQMLPDRDSLLFTLASRSAGENRWDAAQIVAHSIKSGTRRTLLERATAARYVSSGHLLYVRGTTVYAVRFDLRRLAVVGDGVPVLENVRRAASAGASGAADFSVSDNGTLVYLSGLPAGAAFGLSLVLADREGRVTPLNLPPGPYRTPRGSPKGGRIAVVSDDGKESFIGVYDIDGSSALYRVTHSGKDRSPVWSPDGLRLAYTSGREGDLGIFSQAVDGTGAAVRLTKPATGEVHVPQSWATTSIGEVLLFDVIKGIDVTLWALTLKDGQSAPFGAVRSTAPTSALFSHDGRLVAYHTTDTGQTTAYVQPFPPTGAKHVVMPAQRSVPHHPLWSPDDRELFYVPTLGTLESVTVTTSPAFKFGVPKPVPRPFQESAPTSARMYDMMPDGRFLSFGLTRPGGATTRQEFHVVLNWFEELKARVPR
jgi:Tol biopolymer transport system component/predicted Ser/Thr protein kinase